MGGRRNRVPEGGNRQSYQCPLNHEKSQKLMVDCDKMGTALIILIWNEREALQQLWHRIPFDAVDEVLVVDAGSTDGTIGFLKSKGANIYFQKKRGRGNAFIEAMDQVRSNKIVFFSGDGNEDPHDIPKIVALLEQGYDLVIAGRVIRKGSKTDDSDDPLRIRKIGNIVMSLIAHLLWRTGVFDAINGLRGMSKEAMKKMKLDAPKHEIELQSTIRAAKLGLRIKEIPTKELERLGGSRKETAGTLKLGYRLGYYLLREIFIGKRFINRYEKM